MQPWRITRVSRVTTGLRGRDYRRNLPAASREGAMPPRPRTHFQTPKWRCEGSLSPQSEVHLSLGGFVGGTSFDGGSLNRGGRRTRVGGTRRPQRCREPRVSGMAGASKVSDGRRQARCQRPRLRL